MKLWPFPLHKRDQPHGYEVEKLLVHQKDQITTTEADRTDFEKAWNCNPDSISFTHHRKYTMGIQLCNSF